MGVAQGRSQNFEKKEYFVKRTYLLTLISIATLALSACGKSKPMDTERAVTAVQNVRTAVDSADTNARKSGTSREASTVSNLTTASVASGGTFKITDPSSPIELECTMSGNSMALRFSPKSDELKTQLDLKSLSLTFSGSENDGSMTISGDSKSIGAFDMTASGNKLVIKANGEESNFEIEKGSTASDVKVTTNGNDLTPEQQKRLITAMSGIFRSVMNMMGAVGQSDNGTSVPSATPSQPSLPGGSSPFPGSGSPFQGM
jgi:hypothetical protein